MYRDLEDIAGTTDADIEMADLTASGNAAARHRRASRAATTPEDRVRLCPHGSGYGTPSAYADNVLPAAIRTRRGHLCCDCGGWWPMPAGAKFFYPRRGEVPAHIIEPETH